VINCGAKIGYSKNTTLSKHLELHHPIEYSEIQTNTDSSDEQPAQCSSKPSGLQTRITDTYPSVEPYCKKILDTKRVKRH